MAISLTKEKFFLLTISAILIVVAIFIRFWQLSSYPVSLSMDEVGFGYSAYSILKTGKDEFGEAFPLVFKALGDYKPGIDVYLTSLSIAVFGENEFAVRFPIAILGLLSGIVFVFLSRQLGISLYVSIASGVWIIISPWHIFFSRTNSEAIIALFFLLFGVLYFLLWVRKESSLKLTASIIFLSLSVWSYNAQRLFIPLLLLGLTLIFRDKIIRAVENPKKLILPFMAGAVLTLPFLYLWFFTDTINSRAGELWLIKDPSLYSQLHHNGYKNISEFLFKNDIYLIFRNWLGQYLNYFDLRLWFWKGLKITPPQYQDIGYLYAVDAPILIAGIYALRKKNKIFQSIIALWFFLGPIPASFTRGDESAVRVLLWLPVFALIIGCGIEWLLKLRFKKFAVVLYTTSLLLSTAYFWDVYKHNFHNFYADLWHYGYKEVSQIACRNKDKYSQIIITDKYGMGWPSVKTVPHLYALFHCQYDPRMYLETKLIYNLEFRQPQWRIDKNLERTLLIGSPWDFPEGFPDSWIMKKIYYPNGQPAFYFVETSKDKLSDKI